eukprot:Rhum_TRINITY_DN14420_c26_g1::Rhum_TRINITY_DN14420_c26_g1_i1::g.89568::m.89568
MLTSRLVLLATSVALHTRKPGHLAAGDELVDGTRPRRRLRQVVVELRRNLAHLGQTRPRDVREVMVLVVVAHVEGQVVQGAVVRVRLRPVDELKVLRQEVPRHRVQAAREERAEQEVEERQRAPQLDDGHHRGHLHAPVEQRPRGDLRRVHEHGTKGVEENLEDAEEELREGVLEDKRLHPRGNVSVEAVVALVAVVLHVVPVEGRGVGDADGDVGDARKELVAPRALHGQHVHDLVDGKEEGVVDCAAHDVRGGEEGCPAPVARRDRCGELDGDEGEHDGDSAPFGLHELPDLVAVLLEDGQLAGVVRLILRGPREVLRVRRSALDRHGCCCCVCVCVCDGLNEVQI